MIWEVAGENDSYEIILPQGVTEIIFNFADEINGIMPGGMTYVKAPRCFVQGLHTHTLQSQYHGKHHLLGIRLHPFRVQSLLGILPSDIKNNIIDLTLVKPGISQLWEQLVEMRSFQEKVELLENSLPELSGPGSVRTQALSQMFLDTKIENFQTVDNLAREVCYSTRQLNRVSHSLFGLSAEELTVYKKFLHAVTLIHHTNQSLTEVAYTAGFYDQAHFCRVFKSYTALTPNAYRKQKSFLPFHIIS